MEEFEALKTAVNSIEGLTQEQKDAILNPASKINQEAGIRGSDLKKLRGENENLKNKAASYSDLADTMAKFNMKAEDISKVAELAGIEKTLEDEKKELKRILEESQGQNKELKSELWRFKQEKELAPTIDKAIESFIDSEGKPITLKPSFAKQAKEEALKGIKDGDDPVIVNDRIQKALTKAHTDQVTFLEENGLVEASGTHKVPEKTSQGSASRSVSNENVQIAQKIMEEGRGSSDSAASAIAALRQKQQ